MPNPVSRAQAQNPRAVPKLGATIKLLIVSALQLNFSFVLRLQFSLRSIDSNYKRHVFFTGQLHTLALP